MKKNKEGVIKRRVIQCNNLGVKSTTKDISGEPMTAKQLARIESKKWYNDKLSNKEIVTHLENSKLTFKNKAILHYQTT